MYDRAVYELEDLRDRFRRLRQENDHLRGAENDLRRIQAVLGDNMVDQAISSAKDREHLVIEQSRKRTQNHISL